MMSNTKIGLYARVSSETQARDNTIESQISEIIKHAESLGEKLNPSLYFIDNGVSGASLERPGLDLLRDKAFEGQVTKVYVLSPDRLSRKSAHQVLLIEEFKRLEVEFHFTNRQIGDSPEDQMLLQIQGVVAEYEREKILERSRRGKLFAAKKGRVSALAHAPYGYFYKKTTEKQDAAYIIHPDESQVVSEAYHLFVRESYSIRQIAKHFMQKGYLTRTGKTIWRPSTVLGMLKNPAYKGEAAYRKTKVKNRIAGDLHKLIPKTRRTCREGRQKEDWISIPVPAIVNKDLFDYAQIKLEQNKKFATRNNKKNKYLLKGLLRCVYCGYTLYGRCTSGNKYKLWYYRCPGQDDSRWEKDKICPGGSIRIEALDDFVWESVKNLLNNPDVIVNEYLRRLEGNKGDFSETIEKKKNENKRFERERSRLIDLFQTGIIEKDEVAEKLKVLQGKMESLDSEMIFLKMESDKAKKSLTVIENLNDFKKSLCKNLDDCSFEEKEKIVRLLIDEIEVDSVNRKATIKHILPMDSQNRQLCSNLGSA